MVAYHDWNLHIVAASTKEVEPWGFSTKKEKKMAQEMRAAEQREAERKANLVRMAQKVSEDLLNYIGTHPRPDRPSIDVGAHENRITLRKKTTPNTLEIVCTDQNTFEVTMDGGAHGPLNQSLMARAVLDWLKR